MKHWLVVVLVLVACRDRDRKKVTTGMSVTETPTGRLKRLDTNCEEAIRTIASSPLTARPQMLLDACSVCGDDWKPLLTWSTPEAEGGPKFSDIEAAMQRCGFCNGNAKQRFLGTLDKARGTNARTPWRELGDVCKAEVSAVPDSRFMSAPYYALDRIARIVSDLGSADTRSRLALLELPLPALSVSGTGVVLPELPTHVTPNVGAVHVSLIGEQIFVGKLPRARLSATGLSVTNDYPGTPVAIADLASTVEKLVVGDPTQTITLLAPHAMPAENLVPVIAAIGSIAPLYLGATAHESPEGWQLPGAIPVGLGRDGDAEVAVTGEMTVQNLGTELAKKAAQDLKRVGVTKR